MQLRFTATFLVLFAALLGVMNVYPLISSRDLVFSSKESSMKSQASVLTSSLSALEYLSSDGVAQVVELLNISDLQRIVVVNDGGFSLYDTSPKTGERPDEGEALPGDKGKLNIDGDIATALGGKVVFRSRFSGDAFESGMAMPVSNNGNITGAVYLYDHDVESAGIVTGIQSELRFFSIIAGLTAIIIITIFSRALTARIIELVKAIRVVGSGDYSHRLVTRGHDELTELGGEFNVLTERLESTEEARRRFVSDASHELRTPLASIRLLSDSIVGSSNMDNATMRDFALDIGDEAERLQRTTEKLLSLTKLDGGISAKPVPVNVNDVAERALHLLTPLAAQEGVTIFRNFSPGCVILSSEDDVHQIVFNLTENAIKYNVYGGSVTLRLSADLESVCFIVEDTGIGIPDEDMPNIFARFYRVDKARSRASGGSGLGLSIVHDTVERCGGSISVEHLSPQGTRFQVRFPLYTLEKREDKPNEDTADP